MAQNDSIRLNKFLAHSGFGSRRSFVEFLQNHTVTINGRRATEPGVRLNPVKDIVSVDGKKVLWKNREEYVYYLVNKPKGVVSTVSDEKGRKNVVSLVSETVRLYPVGRLDIQSSGLVLLTNDGELTNHLTHPKYHIPKTYQVLIQGAVSQGKLEKLRNGVALKDGLTAPAEVRVLKQFPQTTLLEIVLFEGKNRQIRRMCAALDLQIRDLKRVAIGPVKIGSLKIGEYRKLSPAEIQQLREQVLPDKDETKVSSTASQLNTFRLPKFNPDSLRKANIVLLVKKDQVLLGMKKRGFGKGKWNGVGGKPEIGESILDAAVRETKEEIGVIPKNLKQVATLNFIFFGDEGSESWNQQVIVYICHHWQGKIQETEEMKPQWFLFNEIPYKDMWEDDQYWLSKILAGKKVQGDFYFLKDEGSEKLYTHRLKEVSSL